MKKTVLILTVAGCMAGCSSTPPQDETRTASANAPQSSRPAQSAVAPAVAARPVDAPRAAVDPLNDPNSPLAKRSIYYDFDQAEIKDEFKPVIQAHARYLIGHRTGKVRIEGNCDERGSREYNLALGQRRAESAKAALKLLGVNEDQVDTVSWGEEKPKAIGHDEPAWAGNRRSDFVHAKAR